MGRLLPEVQAHSRSLLGGYYRNGVYYNTGYSCYNRAGCLAGAIIGAVVFGLIALILFIWLMLRLRKQRAAQQAYYNQQNQQGYGANTTAAPPYPGYTNQYGQPYPQQQQQQQQPYPQPGYAPQAGAGAAAPPPANMTDAQRAEWEAEQYAKYGEAGLVQGYPANGPSNGVQMTQIPPGK